MKTSSVIVLCFLSAALPIGFYRYAENHVSEEKIVFKHDEKANKNDPVASLLPNGIFCVNVPALAKQDQPKGNPKDKK